MTAKEMFEELGFNYFEYDNQIAYEQEIRGYDDDTYYVGITFDLKYKDIKDTYSEIDMKLLKAINKQVEELGWNI